MRHLAIDRVIGRAEQAKEDSDFAYFNDLLLVSEALAKTVVLGMLSAVVDDPDRHRYRVGHALVRASGIGEWARALEDLLKGPASQFLAVEAYEEQKQLAHSQGGDAWQCKSVKLLSDVLDGLGIESEKVPFKTDMTRWFRLLVVLRNKTRGHGAFRSSKFSDVSESFGRSLDIFYSNFSLFHRPWAYLHRNLSGKYRIAKIAGDCSPFEYLKSESHHGFPDGIYVCWGVPKLVPLFASDVELEDFYYSNGGYTPKTYEMLSYFSGRREAGDGAGFAMPPGVLPPSETQGLKELVVQGRCLSNSPDPFSDYIERPGLQAELLSLILDERRSVVTLRGRGGIGKTSLALRVLQDVFLQSRFDVVVWLSARDVDLHASGPKPVRPDIVSPGDIASFYSDLFLSKEDLSEKGFDKKKYFEGQLSKCDIGSCLFVLDNFETTQSPIEIYNWIDAHIRLPNKVLITTRLRDFKGDYPVDVQGMPYGEARELVDKVAMQLGISDILTESFSKDVIDKSAGHPYVIKILLGEVSALGRIGSVPKLIAGSDDILTALFERTYAALSPCAQRAFLTLSGWASSVPRIALEAVLLRSTREIHEVEAGVDMLIQYSLVEPHAGQKDDQEFLFLPLVAAAFGKRKLNISPLKGVIEEDVEILKMLGPSRRDELHLGLMRKLENFVSILSKRADRENKIDDYVQILEMICRNYPPGWAVMARWWGESGRVDGFEKSEEALERYLEFEPGNSDAWRKLARVRRSRGDSVGELHAFISRSELPDVQYYEISETANRLNTLVGAPGGGMNLDDKKRLAARLLDVMQQRISEAGADDFSRMAWLAIHLEREGMAQSLVKAGLKVDSGNLHCQKLADRLGLNGGY